MPGSTSSDDTSIAIVGMGARYPNVSNLSDFWEMLVEGRDHIQEVPEERFDIERFYDPRPEQPGAIVNRHGGFVDDPDGFDASLFGVPPRKAVGMDPQCRKFLEVAWRAFQDAGYPVPSLEGTHTGVFTGVISNEYHDEMSEARSHMDVYSEIGTSRAAISGRLSHTFGLVGPSLSLDAACSSSLCAAHLACQSLASGRTDMALAGGVNLVLRPEPSIAFSGAGMLANDGRCKFGDARADGFVRSDGFGAVVLKRLEDAVADDDRIYGVIRASVSNNDGRLGQGLYMTPSYEAHVDLLDRAYRRAGVDRERLAYVEAHGTGTSAGDPVEIRALADQLTSDVERSSPLYLGSVKSNIGHTEGAAGVAGLIKLGLVLSRRHVPPSLHVEEPNPDVEWSETDVRIATDNRELDREAPLVGGVSSFGISGTNAHLVVEEWRGTPKPEGAVAVEAEIEDAGSSPRMPRILPLSAHTPEALSELSRRYQNDLEGDAASLEDVCYTASRRREHRPYRVAVAGRSHEELRERLPATPSRSGTTSDPDTVFVFSGQGGQWADMARAMLACEDHPVTRALTTCDRLVREQEGWSILEALRDPEGGWMASIGRLQPIVFAMQVGVASWWRACGVTPDAVIGHSFGEVAAAHVAGHLSLEEAVRVVCARSRLLERIQGEGALAAIHRGVDETRDLLTRGGWADVSVAVANSPDATVVSGPMESIDALVADLESREVSADRIRADVAAHSARVEPLLEELGGALQGLQPRGGDIPMYSTVEGEAIAGTALDADYWQRNLREFVQFSGTTESLLDDGYRHFVEIGPHPVLAHPVRQTMRQHEVDEGTVTPSMRRDDDPFEIFAESLASFYEIGGSIDWNYVQPEGDVVSLPPYPFDRESYWFDETDDDTPSGARVRRRSSLESTDDHPFLERHFELGSEAGTSVWEVTLDLDRFPYVRDHRLRDRTVFPGSGYVEMALAVGEQLFDGEDFRLEHVDFQDILLISDDRDVRLQAIATPRGRGRFGVAFFSVVGSEESNATSRRKRAEMELVAVEHETGPALHEELLDLEGPGEEATRIERDECYRRMREAGMQDGSQFRVVDSLDYEDRQIRGDMEIPDEIVSETSTYCLHPSVLDGMLQLSALAVLLEDEAHGGTIFPAESVERVTFYRTPTVDFQTAARVRHVPTPEEPFVELDVAAFDSHGRPVADIEGFRARRVQDDETSGRIDRWFYRWQWERATDSSDPDTVRSVPASDGLWLLYEGDTSAADPLVEEMERLGLSYVRLTRGATFEADEAARRLQIPSVSTSSDLEGELERWMDDETTLEGVVDLGALGAGAADAPLDFEGLVDRTMESVRLVQWLTEGNGHRSIPLWMVTEGVYDVDGSVDGALSVRQQPAWGLSRVVRSEHPELELRCVDLDGLDDEATRQALVASWLEAPEARELALREGTRWVHRLQRRSNPSSWDDRTVRATFDDSESFEVVASNERGFDSLRFVPSERIPPGSEEVEIEVETSGLNFAEVISTLELIEEELGSECVGRVLRTGSNVEGLEPGDRVMAGNPNVSCFGRYATTRSDFVVPLPDDVSAREGATVPVAYLTAYYAMVGEANLSAHESILIHSASGGVGHAAVQLAQAIGADIHATAGTDRKRNYLRETIGLERVSDSRSVRFAEDVAEWTDGEGVDVVLNTVTGELVRRGLELLKPMGRFLDLSKPDMFDEPNVDLKPFEKDLSYHGIEVPKLVEHRPREAGEMLSTIGELLADGTIEPVPVDRSFPIDRVRESFRYMRQGTHIGKIVLSMDVDEVETEQSLTRDRLFVEDGTYLLTGGTGGLGLEVADWMSTLGAGCLVLVSRSGADAEAEARLETMRERGTEVHVARGDVTDRESLEDVLSRIDADHAPLRGVFHLAGVLDDRTVARQNRESLARPMAPKVLGAHHLDRLTTDRDLDHFVLFSSASAHVGSPGQSNYAAGNAFMDALARRRRAQDQPALSLAWGGWTEVGLAAAERRRGARLAERGLEPIAPEEGIEALERAMLHRHPPELGIFGIDWRTWADSFPHLESDSAYRHLVPSDDEADTTGTTTDLHRDIRGASGNDRRQLVEQYLRDEVADVLGSSPDEIDFGRSISRVGLDSLMVVELRVRLEDHLDVELTKDDILGVEDLSELVDCIARELD